MIKIVTDSSITIQPELLQQYDITVVPLSVTIDGIVFSDTDLKEEGKFLQLIANSHHLPKTSQPPVGIFSETYESLVKQGADDIIAIHLTSSLSGTIEASRQGALLAKAPVTIIDSGFTDQALAFQVLKAAQLASSGASKQEILEAIHQMRQKTSLYMGLSSLENLVKGGRVSRVSGLLGSLLNIHVMLTMVDSNLVTLKKGRGKKIFKQWLADFKTDLSQHTVRHLGISYSGNKDFAEQLVSELSPLVSCPITLLETGAIIQTHTGAGAFAVMVAYD